MRLREMHIASPSYRSKNCQSNLGNLTRLVISSDERDPVGVSSLQRQQAGQRFQTVVAAIDEIAHENIARVGNGS